MQIKQGLILSETNSVLTKDIVRHENVSFNGMGGCI